MNNTVDICIPVHNAWPFVERCLRSVIAHTKDYRLIIHDDASDSHTAGWLVEFATNHEGPIVLVRSEKQCWFTTSVNRCLAEARADNWIAIINSDVEIQEDDWVDKFKDPYLSDPEAGLLGAVDGAYSEGPPPFYVEPGKVQGHFWFLHGSRLIDVGRLDEREPSEVHIRSDDAWSAAFRKAGYSNYYVTNIRHVHGGDTHPGGGASWDRDVKKLPHWIDVVHARAKLPSLIVRKP